MAKHTTEISEDDLLFMESSLSNDENSSDEEIIENFIANGIPETLAKASIQYRMKFMNGIMETGSLLKMLQGEETTDFMNLFPCPTGDKGVTQ